MRPAVAGLDRLTVAADPTPRYSAPEVSRRLAIPFAPRAPHVAVGDGYRAGLGRGTAVHVAQRGGAPEGEISRPHRSVRVGPRDGERTRRHGRFCPHERGQPCALRANNRATRPAAGAQCLFSALSGEAPGTRVRSMNRGRQAGSVAGPFGGLGPEPGACPSIGQDGDLSGHPPGRWSREAVAGPAKGPRPRHDGGVSKAWGCWSRRVGARGARLPLSCSAEPRGARGAAHPPCAGVVGPCLPSRDCRAQGLRPVPSISGCRAVPAGSSDHRTGGRPGEWAVG